jgi:hypothetical protein
MNTKRSCRSALSRLSASTILWSVQAQNDFQNLDFESASLVPVPAGVRFASAFPGWTAYVGGVPLDTALYNDEFLDSSGLSIVDRKFANGTVIQGNYTAILQAGLGLGTFQPADTRLSQTGRVPNGAESLLFRARFTYGRPPTSFSVTLGGQNLSLGALSTSEPVSVLTIDTFDRHW